MKKIVPYEAVLGQGIPLDVRIPGLQTLSAETFAHAACSSQRRWFCTGGGYLGALGGGKMMGFPTGNLSQSL